MFQFEVLWTVPPCRFCRRIPTFHRSLLPQSSGWTSPCDAM